MAGSMLQVYAKPSAEAVEFYRKAFRAVIGNDWRNADGSCAHVDMNFEGVTLAVSEAPDGNSPGTNMQFCISFSDDESVDIAYSVLSDGASIVCPIGECPYSRRMFALTDRFGVNWCVYTIG